MSCVGTQFHVRAKAVVNATGQFADAVRQLDKKDTQPICQPGSGVHIILPDYYWHAVCTCTLFFMLLVSRLFPCSSHELIWSFTNVAFLSNIAMCSCSSRDMGLLILTKAGRVITFFPWQSGTIAGSRVDCTGTVRSYVKVLVHWISHNFYGCQNFILTLHLHKIEIIVVTC